MEIQFQKKVVPYLQTISQQVQTQELTQQVRIPEAMPDIERVLAGWGQTLIRGKEWRDDCYHIVGGVKTWILYEPEDGSYPRCVESWLPFQMKWELPDTDRDGTIIVCPFVPSVDGRMLSDRKLMVRANVSIKGKAMLSSEAMLYLPDVLPPDIQVLNNTYAMRLPEEAGEKAFELEETVTLPTVEQPMETLMRYTLEPMLLESKIVADKLVLRGLARLQLLYLGTDRRLHRWSVDLPFSQYAQLTDQYDSGAEAKMCFAVTGLEMESNENGSMVMKAGITAQYTIYGQKQIAMIEDMYSPYRDVRLCTEDLRLPAVLDMQHQSMCAEVYSEGMPNQIFDVTFRWDVPKVQVEGEQGNVTLTGVFQLLGCDEDGYLCNENCRWESSLSMPTGDDTEICVELVNGDAVQIVGSTFRTDLQLDVMTTMEKPLHMIMGGEMGEVTEPDPNRPSLILRRMGDETLWELAKKTGSTVEGIMKLNGLQQDPPVDQMLIIPVV